MNKLKIVYIISTLVKSGPVNVLYNLVKFIDKTKFDITIITLSPEPHKHSRWDEFEALGINLKSLNLSRLQGYFYGGIKLKKIIDEIRPNLIHTHCFRSNLFASIFLLGYRRCTTVHSDYKVDLTQLYPGVVGWGLFFLNHISLLLIKNNICCSEILAESLNNRYKYISFSHVNNGIDTEVFKPVSDKINLRKKLNLPEKNKIFIWVGSFIDRKNPVLLADVIKDLDTSSFFIMCGDGPLLNKVKQIIGDRANVLLTGRIENVTEYLQASDYYISTSLSEGLPMSVMEGLACGNTCFLTDIPQHKIFHGDFIKFFELKNEEQLRLMIGTANTQNPYTRKDIYNYICENFSAAKMAYSYEEKYLMLCGDKIK